MTPKLSLIIVNYRSSDKLEHCLRSLHVATGASLEIILVDNSPEDEAKVMLEQSGFHGHYFLQSENIGFSAAANFGAQHARGEILCFAHPDILFEAGSLDWLIAWVEQHPRSIAGPRQRDTQGNILTSSFPFLTRRAMWGPAEHQGSPWPVSWQPFLGWLHPQLRFARRNRIATTPHQVPVLNSSCLVMPRSVWEEVGEFNAELNFVGLESDWFSRAKDLGLTTWYLPDAEIFHDRSSSIHRAEAWKVRELTDHDRKWYAKRFGAVAIIVLVVVLWFEHRLRPNNQA